MDCSIEIRRSDCKAAILPTNYRTSSSMRNTGQISDISPSGCSIATNVSCCKGGMRDVIRPEGMEGLTGIARWIETARAGAEFDNIQHARLVGHLTARYRRDEVVRYV